MAKKCSCNKPVPPWVIQERGIEERVFNKRAPRERSVNPYISNEYPSLKPWYADHLKQS